MVIPCVCKAVKSRRGTWKAGRPTRWSGGPPIHYLCMIDGPNAFPTLVVVEVQIYATVCSRKEQSKRNTEIDHRSKDLVQDKDNEYVVCF
jgi:hypothetical protein